MRARRGSGSGSIIDERAYIVERIGIDRLQVHPKYQRPVKKPWVNEIASNFSQFLHDLPRVATMGGRYYIVDGQHTVLALKRLGVSTLRIRNYGDMSLEEQARNFNLVNDKRRTVTQYEKYRAALNYDEELIEVENWLVEYDLQIVKAAQFDDRRHGHLACAGTIMKLSERTFATDRRLLKDAIKAISELRETSTPLLQGIGIHALALFIKYVAHAEGRSYNIDKLIERVRTNDAILGKILNLRVASGAVGRRTAFSLALAEAYKHRARDKKEFINKMIDTMAADRSEEGKWKRKEEKEK